MTAGSVTEHGVRSVCGPLSRDRRGRLSSLSPQGINHLYIFRPLSTFPKSSGGTLCRRPAASLTKWAPAVTARAGCRLRDLNATFRAAVVFKDQKDRLVTFKQCFVSREAVDWLVASSHAASRENLVRIGRTLAAANGRDLALLERFMREHEFEDGNSFFRFVHAHNCARASLRLRVRCADVGDVPSAPHSLTPAVPRPDFDTVPGVDAHVIAVVWPLPEAIRRLLPVDVHNTASLDNIILCMMHPLACQDPKVTCGGGGGDDAYVYGGYNLVVEGAGTGGLATAGRARAHARRADRRCAARRRLPQRRLRAVQCADPRGQPQMRQAGEHHVRRSPGRPGRAGRGRDLHRRRAGRGAR